MLSLRATTNKIYLRLLRQIMYILVSFQRNLMTTKTRYCMIFSFKCNERNFLGKIALRNMINIIIPIG